MHDERMPIRQYFKYDVILFLKKAVFQQESHVRVRRISHVTGQKSTKTAFGDDFESTIERSKNKAAELCDQSVAKWRLKGAKLLKKMVTPAGLEPALPG